MSDVNLPTPATPQDANVNSLQTSRGASQAEPRLRIWPGVLIVALTWLVFYLCRWIVQNNTDIENPLYLLMTMVFSGMLGMMALMAWWLFASRRPSLWERLGTIVAFVVIATAATLAMDPTFRGMPTMIYLPRPLATAWVLWLLVTPFLAWPIRRAGILAVFLLGWGYMTLLAFDGVWGNFQRSDIHWRWAETSEVRASRQRAAERVEPRQEESQAFAAVALAPGDWPAFRGPDRDGRLVGVKIDTQWEKNPPKLLWKKLVGPGWSSFTVIGNRVYTQEQWNEDEAVVCRDSDTGERLWKHLDSARFTEAVGGVGPRATPTFHDGKIYALGATGKLNCLDAASGKLHWSRDIAADAGAKVPIWGFASSPLVAMGLVTVYAGGPEGNSVLAYNASTGDLAWHGGNGQFGYCSPQLAKLGGQEQLLIATDAGLWALRPDRGDVVWKHEWSTNEVPRIVQPAVIGDADVLIGTGMGIGTRRLKIDNSDGQWTDKSVWTTKAINPYYNDFVIYQDHLYGFDGEFFTCVKLEDGKRKWRERGYGNGQVLLLADQGLLVILAEDGKVALVDASPLELKELHRFDAISGKTWNHPVIAHGRLFVRNGEEAACFQLTEIAAPGK